MPGQLVASKLAWAASSGARRTIRGRKRDRLQRAAWRRLKLNIERLDDGPAHHASRRRSQQVSGRASAARTHKTNRTPYETATASVSLVVSLCLSFSGCCFPLEFFKESLLLRYKKLLCLQSSSRPVCYAAWPSAARCCGRLAASSGKLATERQAGPRARFFPQEK